MRLLLVLCLTLASLGHVRAEPATHIRFTLDWKTQGIHAWYWLAKTKGYFAAENLDVDIDEGEGSAATTVRIMSGAYDAGFGDINAIIQNAAVRPDVTPVMVYMVYNDSPLVIASLANGPIQSVKDLANHKVGAPAGSAALALLPPLARANGVDPKTIGITNVAPNLVEQLIINRQIDATTTYNITTYFNFRTIKLDPDKDVRWLYYKDLGVDLYSNGVMVSQRLAREKPEAVRGLVRAINRALKEVIANPDIGIETIAGVERLTDKDIEKKRILYTFKTLMDTKEVASLGLGDVSDAKLAKSIDYVTEAFDLPRKPAPASIFRHEFLPPKSERIASFPPS